MKKRHPHLSKTARAAVITAATATITRLNSDPAFSAANSRRMKRQRADPAFNALHGASLRRLHADPDFAGRRDANIARLNADSAFRAEQRASVSIPPKTRAAIIAALKADPGAIRVARKIRGASSTTVRRIAKAAGI